MYGWDILCGISKVPFEIPHKISDPYIEICNFYTTLNLGAHHRFSNAPRAFIHQADARLTTRSREASNSKDSGLDISNRSEI